MTMNTRVQKPSGDYLMSSNNGAGIVRRIRTPNQHDVLCGRGGGINSHIGNKHFRDYVAERRLDYNLAPSKVDKAEVAKQVMELVTGKGGRFLQRDQSGGIGSWWVEIDEVKAMAKTSQALREGAPTIRAQHHDVIEENRRTKRSRATPTASPESSPPAFVPLVSNSQFHEHYRPLKKLKMEGGGTPTLVPASPTHVASEPPPLTLTPASSTSAPFTTNSLNDWKLSGHLDGEFVNPFDFEEELMEQFYSSESYAKESDSCPQCGSAVKHGKVCTCMAQFDPLHQMTELLSM